ncbi:MAG: hypothetical protein FD123_3014 [Bacteroidetes bacterium]|nr:MAG: hypothetical protein FD123_3014 [Bacteroidota bacterium]
MAIHNQLNDLTRESISEMMTAIDHCILFKKDNAWKTKGGILGVPTTILLFSIVDAIGSYYARTEKKFPIKGSKPKSINNTRDHFYVLNGELFGQTLSKGELDILYQQYRNKLTHNLALSAFYFLEIGNDGQSFFEKTSIGTSNYYSLRIKPFYQIVQNGVNTFLPILDQVLDSSDTKQNRISKSDLFVPPIPDFSDKHFDPKAYIEVHPTGTTQTIQIVGPKRD